MTQLHAPLDLMIPSEILDRLEAIEAMCVRYGVIRLDVFGSATTGHFDPLTSDYDFIVDFGAYRPGLWDRYLALEDALEALLGRPVDLNAEPDGRNRYYSATVTASRVNIYAGGDGQAA